MLAARHGHMRVVRLLFTVGADVEAKSTEGKTAQALAREEAQKSIAEYLAKPEQDWSVYPNALLRIGAAKGDRVRIEQALRQDGDINHVGEDGRNALHLAVDLGDPQLVELLLGPRTQVDVSDQQGGSPLHQAARNGNLAVLHQLLRFGANTSVRDHAGRTPLHDAAAYGNRDVLGALLEGGADLAAVDEAGRTPLMEAVASGTADHVEILLKAGATPDVRDAVGLSAVDLARQASNRRLVGLLSGDPATLVGPSAAATPRLMFSQGHSHQIKAVAFSPDGDYAISGGHDNRVILWEVASGKELATLEGHINTVNTLGFTPDGRFAVSGGRDGRVILWNLDTRHGVRLLGGQSGEVNDLVVSPRGDRLAVATADGSVHLWDLADLRIRRVLHGHDGAVRAVEFTPDGARLASGGDDGRLLLWDGATGRYQRALPGHEGAILDLARSGGADQLLVSGGKDKTLRVWNLGETGAGRVIQTDHEIHHIAPVPGVARVFIGSNARSPIQAWDLESGVSMGEGRIPTSVYQPVGVHPSGDFLLVGVARRVAMWQTADLEQGRSFASGGSPIAGLCTASTGDWLAVARSDDAAVQLLDLHERGQVQAVSEHDGDLWALACSADGRRLATLGWDETVRLWDREQDAAIATFPVANNSSGTVAFSRDSRLMAFSAEEAGSDDDEARTVWVVDAEHGRVRWKLLGHKDDVDALSFSRDGRHLASAGSDGRLLLWSMATGKPVQQRHTGKKILHLAYSPDGKRIVTAGSRLSLWNALDLHEIARLPVPEEFNLMSAAFSADGHTLYVGSGDGEIIVYDLRAGRKTAVLGRHEGAVEALLLWDEGRLLISAGNDGTIRFWDLNRRQEVANLMVQQDGGWAVLRRGGLFDASDAAMTRMYYVLGWDTIELSQLKDRYFEPGLLQKILGYNDESLRDAKGLSSVALYPRIELSEAGHQGQFAIRLENRGGGIGRVVIALNGKEVAADARGAEADPDAEALDIALDTSGHPFLKPGGENRLEIRAYNKEGYLVSRGLESLFEVPAEEATPDPRVFILAVGVSDYRGDALDLRYASKDAADMATALEIGAHRLFGSENTVVRVLTTDASSPEDRPTKENLLAALKGFAAEAVSSDILVLYLSGHGVNWGGQDGDFFYLTEEAHSASRDTYADSAIRNAATLSSRELVELIKQVPALKQMMVIDTCASGRVVDNLLAKKDMASSTVRALDKMKDRTGMHIITGSTADAVSYEASQYGQGLLTYSLLEGIKGAALNEGRFVDVVSLFQYARNRVPDLANDIGGVQRPVLLSRADSYYVGALDKDDKKGIPLAEAKPIFQLSSLSEMDSMDDLLELGQRVDDVLRDAAARGTHSPLVFVDTNNFPRAYRLRGFYALVDQQINGKVNLFLDKRLVGRIEFSGAQSGLESVAEDIVRQARDLIAGQ